MSSAIIDSYINDKAVILSNSTIARPIELPVSWSFLQIGLIYGMTTGSFANITGTPRFYIGLCSGDTAILGDITSSYFVGFRTNDATMVEQSASLNYTYRFGTVTGVVLSPTQTLTTADINTANQYIQTTLWDKRTIGFYQITRSLANPTLCHFFFRYQNAFSGATLGVFPDSTLLREVVSVTPTGTDLSLGNSNRANLAVNQEASGSLDHLCIAWDREHPNPDLIVYSVAVAVLA